MKTPARRTHLRAGVSESRRPRFAPYFANATAVALTASFAGAAFATVVAIDPLVLAIEQQLALGTTIVDETIVSQHAARRQTSRPQLS